MPAEVVLGAMFAALKALLVAYAPLTSLLKVAPAGYGGGPAIYDDGDAPQLNPGTTMPYLVIGAGTQVPWHTMGEAGMGRWGWNCTVMIKAVGQGNEATGLAILSKVATVLYEGQPLTLAGYSSAWCDEITVQPTITTVLAGVTTREWPAILRVFCHDT